eukprot:224621_1
MGFSTISIISNISKSSIRASTVFEPSPSVDFLSLRKNSPFSVSTTPIFCLNFSCRRNVVESVSRVKVSCHCFASADSLTKDAPTPPPDEICGGLWQCNRAPVT